MKDNSEPEVIVNNWNHDYEPSKFVYKIWDETRVIPKNIQNILKDSFTIDLRKL